MLVFHYKLKLNTLLKGLLMGSLTRPRNGRVVAGVCAAIANRFGISPFLVRVIFLVSMLLPGPQILIYIAGWILIPDQKY